MNEEQQNPAQSAQEDDLFSGSPAAVKPLFEEPQAPAQPKPLFASGGPADEAFIEQRLKEAGPTAFVVPPVQEPQPEALAQPEEIEQPGYIPSGKPAPEEPVIVTAAPHAGEEQRTEIPQQTVQEASLTAPRNRRTTVMRNALQRPPFRHSRRCPPRSNSRVMERSGSGKRSCRIPSNATNGY